MFLGDGGSVTLGFLVTASLVYFAQSEGALIKPVTALWLVAVPLMDMLSTMLIRAKEGRKLMEADRSHLHHTLMDMGLSARQALVLLICGASLCAIIGLALEAIPAYLSLLCYVLVFIGHCLLIIRREAVGQWLNRTGVVRVL
jgi:UDP-GlcNAc:undecaprenyl-phosphate GlcNAc-1-phosphate transferase